MLKRIKRNEHSRSFWIGIGIAIGTAVGVATDNIGVWLPIGIAIGAGVGTSMTRQNKEDKKSTC